MGKLDNVGAEHPAPKNLLFYVNPGDGMKKSKGDFYLFFMVHKIFIRTNSTRRFF